MFCTRSLLVLVPPPLLLLRLHTAVVAFSPIMHHHKSYTCCCISSLRISHTSRAFQGGGFLSYSANFAFHEGHKPINSQYTWDLLPFKFTKKTDSGFGMEAGVMPEQHVGGEVAPPPLPSLDIVPGSVS
eukprot:COSAG04_NODE_5061_length_1760_cov_1.295003_3_plen_128_part_01